MKAQNLTKGETFGFLKVEKKIENYTLPSGVTKTQYLCRCVCGRYVKVLRQSLVSGNTISCGCKGLPDGKPREVKEREKNESGNCYYNPKRINCEYVKCSTCGWNPENKELREKRLEKLKERML